jgi:hypothetical protein
MCGIRRCMSGTKVVINRELPGDKAGKPNSSIFNMDYFK